MKIIFSWDDGALEDQKLFELHEKYKIPGMFFVPTFNREGRKVLTKEMIRSSESEYVQFGGHTQNHTYLTSIPLEDVEEEVLLNKNYLQECLGHEIKHFCLPGGPSAGALPGRGLSLLPDPGGLPGPGAGDGQRKDCGVDGGCGGNRNRPDPTG